MCSDVPMEITPAQGLSGSIWRSTLGSWKYTTGEEKVCPTLPPHVLFYTFFFFLSLTSPSPPPAYSLMVQRLQKNKAFHMKWEILPLVPPILGGRNLHSEQFLILHQAPWDLKQTHEHCLFFYTGRNSDSDSMCILHLQIKIKDPTYAAIV